MHTISFKSDDAFYGMIEEMSKRLQTSKSELIRRAVMHYKENLEKESLKEQFKQASLKVRKQSLEEAEYFDNTLDDGL